MAKSRNKQSRNVRGGGAPRKTQRERERELTDLAYKMGVVQRGLSNPNSQVSDAYNRGKTKPVAKQKKPLL